MYSEGSKVQPDWLFSYLQDPITIRPNLQVRMPSFDFTDSQWNSIIKAFQYREDDLLDLLISDKEVSKLISEKELKQIFVYKKHFKNINRIFKRVFG